MSNSFSIIIDADVARSSGMTVHPVSRNSRALLESVSKNGHTATMCPILVSEWKKHKSLFAKKWLASMVAKKKVIFKKPKGLTVNLIDIYLKDDNKIATAMKDAHLIDGALDADNIIASNDNIARKLYCEMSITCKELRSIKWFNAVADNEFVSKYLESCCHVPNRYHLISKC